MAAKNRAWLANALLLAVTILIGLSIGEFAVRYFLSGYISLFPRNIAVAHYDGVTLRRLIPNTTFWHTSVDGRWQFRTNAQGFRDDENYAYRKPEGQRRILVLGDSQAEGYEARQSAIFPKVLETRLRAKGLNVQVLNSGISGFGTAEELMFLEHEGMKYQPDAIVLAFFGNDFDDNVKSDLYVLKDGVVSVNSTVHDPGVKPIAVMDMIPGAAWLSQNSYLFSLATNTAWEIGKRALSAIGRERLTTEYAVRVSAVDKYQEKLAVALLNRVKAVAHAAGIPFVIVEIPGYDPSRRPGSWEPSVPETLTPAFIAASDIYLPAADYLAGVKDGTITAPHGDHHISELTHAKIAEALERIFTKKIPISGND
jgi:lysophospholipase L1-like esterase